MTARILALSVARALAVWLCLSAAALAQAVDIRIDLSEQRMSVKRWGTLAAVWPVSTARPGKVTPLGTFRPQVMKRTHYSTLYDNAPMPHSIFFSGNYAIHGTTSVSQLGQPASAGCVRLHPDNARLLYGWVRDAGMENTRIRVVR